MKTTKWSHLPNAIHIDRVLESVRAHPNEWIKSWYEILSAELSGVMSRTFEFEYDTGRRFELDGIYRDVYDSVGKSSFDIAGGLTYSPVLALVVYDESAHLLNSSVEEIRFLHELGHPYATLMLPAIVAFQRIGNLII